MTQQGRSAGGSRGRLPAEWTSFVGRRDEVAEIKRLLSTARLVTLTGVGGAGKTRVAVRVATELRRTFPAGVWLVDLAPVWDASVLALVVAETLGLVDLTQRPVDEVLAGYLNTHELLLVLDGCEHLLDACADFVGRMLPRAPDLRVLCTSRQPLGAVSEHVWAVPPLPVPDPLVRPRDCAANAQYAAVALFAERAVAAGFVLSADNQEEVVEVCRRLDGLPLAIELAAAQLRIRSLDQLLSSLADRFRVLAVRHATPSRHRTLEATFDWSFALSTPQEQLLWSRLTIFRDSFDAEAAGAVCNDRQLPADAIEDALSGLVDKSVLIRDDTAGRVRYRLLETVREYGRRRRLPADSEPTEATLRVRHRDWYLRVARRFDADWFGPNQIDWLSRMHRDRGNLHAALGFSLATPAEAGAGLELAARLMLYWFASGLLHEGRYWLDLALAASPEPTPTRAVALAAYCQLTLPTGDVDPARARAAELCALADRTGELRLRALAHRAVGMNAMVGNDLPTARVELDRALALFAEIGERSTTVALAWLSRTMTALFSGDLTRAAAMCAEGRAVCEARGDRWWLAHTFSASSHVAVYAGDLPAAIEYTRQALELAAALGDTVIVAVSVERFAWIAGARGNHERAARLLGAADQMWQQLGRVMYGAAQWLRGHDTCVANARAALGESAYEDSSRIGAAFTLDQATADALHHGPPRPAAPIRTGPSSTLTKRESEVAALVAQGLSNRQIATRLVISPRTAESHVENILRKLGLTSRTQLAVWAIERQDPDPADHASPPP